LDRAALTSVGQPAVLSHLTALRRWGLAVLADPAVHLTVPVRRHPTSIPGRLVIHRVRSPFPASFWVDGLPTQNLPAALAASWPLLDPRRRRAPVIEAARRRLVTPTEIESAIGSVACGGELRELVGLVDAGCESELEIWGLLHVFDAPGLRHAVRQKWVRAGGRNYRLDIAFEEERVAVELDGFATHGTRDRRESDLARDAALAAAGWLTIRFSYERLTKDPDGCRREVLAALAARRAWRRSG
jgi:very-short-patch-repair endonuclease